MWNYTLRRKQSAKSFLTFSFLFFFFGLKRESVAQMETQTDKGSQEICESQPCLNLIFGLVQIN